MIGSIRDDAEIAALRRRLRTNLDLATREELSRDCHLSLVCIQSLIEDERRRRHLIKHPVTAAPVVPEPDPLTVGEDAFLAYVRAGRVDPETDTVKLLARRFLLSEVYVKTRLHEIGVFLPSRPQRRAA